MLSFKKIKKSLFFMQLTLLRRISNLESKSSCFFSKIICFKLLIIMSLAFPVFAQQEQQKEYVQVVNVELILRVLKDGSPVGGLKKNDFLLYEDGEKSEINGFFEIHRRIAPVDESQKQPHQGRLYLLFFWVGNSAADVEGVLNKFFSTIYREGDRVILSTLLKTFELPSRQDITRVTVAFLEQWRQEAKNGLAKRLQFIEDLNRLFEDLVRKLILNSQEKEENSRDVYYIKNFILQYSTAIQEYRLRELSPDVTALEAMARSLLPIKNDKFALVFFQHDTLPLFDISMIRDHLLMNKLTDISAELSEINFKAKSVFDIRRLSEQLKSLFIQANTQFHLLFLSPDKTAGQPDATSSSLSLTKSEDIFSNWDQVMQEISKDTGGLMLDGDRMVGALDQVASFEDIYYHITYVPREHGVKKQKIDIRVNQPGMKVIYGRMLEMNDLPLVKIAKISATSQLIRLAVADFYPISKDGIATGLLSIYVTGNQTGNEPSRLLLSQESETAGTIELPFIFPQPGTWNLQVRVIDQITGQQAVKKVKVEIAAAIPASTSDSDPDPILIALLAKAAAYAEKLKKAAFHFICREEVTEDVFARNSYYNRLPSTSRTYWIYDYQIIGWDEKIAENRILLQKKRTKVHQEKAQLETLFCPLYSFYMPVTILAREKQHLYHYRLLGKEKVNKKPVWHIADTRRDLSQSIPWGEIWVSEEDGAVLKIQVEQTSIIGFEELAQKAKKGGFVPVITTIHEYNVEKNQIRFPSKTTFIERYNSERYPSLSNERSRTYFEYKNHQFFSISTSVEEKNE